jgi:hypothetical protein
MCSLTVISRQKSRENENNADGDERPNNNILVAVFSHQFQHYFVTFLSKNGLCFAKNGACWSFNVYFLIKATILVITG